MEFTLPQEALDAAATPSSTSSNGSKMGEFSLPDDALDSAASDLIQQKDFSPEQYAADNPSQFDLALRADKLRKARPLGDKLSDVGDALSGKDTYWNAAKGLGHFILGLGVTGAHTVAQGGLGIGAKAVRAAGAGGLADSMEAESLTQKAEATLAGQKAEENVRNTGRILGNNLAPAASRLLQDPDSEPVDDAALQQVADLSHREDFNTRVENVKKARQLESGKPIDTGVAADISRWSLGGDNPSEALGPEALANAGARPVSPLVVDSMAAASDPQNIALALAPMLPGAATIGGRLTQGAGKLLQLPMSALERIPGKLGRAATAVGTGAGLGLAEGALHNLPATTKIVGGVVAAKGLQKLGQALEAQGAELATGAPSQFTTRAATAAAKGLTDLPASAARVIGDSAAKGVSTAAGFAPINAAMSEDPRQFAESEVGAGLMGAALSHLASDRPQMVEALRPHLRSEGAASMDTSSDLGRKSADFVMKMSDEARDRTLETMGALQGIPGEAKTGEKANTKIYVLSAPDYAAEVKKIGGAPDDGGRGFFLDKEGRAIINGEATGNATPEDMAHTIGHEAGGHAAINILRAMGAPGAQMHKALMNTVMKNIIKNGRLAPEYEKSIDAYNKAFDPSGKTQAVDPHSSKAIEEFLAEQAGRVIAGRGAADLSLPKNLRDKINEGVGNFAARFMGIDPQKIGQTSGLNEQEIGAVTGAMSDTLRQIVGMKQRGELKPIAEQPAPKPAPAPVAPTSGDVNTSARLNSLNVDQDQLGAARDEAMKDAVATERVRRGKRPMSEKSADEVAADAGTEFDQQAERYFKALEEQGVPHPDNLDINEAIRLNELTSEQGGLPNWQKWGGRSVTPARPAEEQRVVDEPEEGEIYPHDSVTQQERLRLETLGWKPDEIAAMPKSQVDRELAKTVKPSAATTTEPDAVDKANTMNRLDREAAAATAEAAKHPIGSPERVTAQEQAADLKRQADALRPRAPQEAAKPPVAPKDATDEAAVTQRLAEAETDARRDAAYAGKRTEGTKAAFVKQAKLGALMDIVTDDGTRDASLLQTRTEDGKSRITGRLDESLPSHRALLREMGVSDEATRHLFNLEPGKTVYIDYNSAKNQEPGDISGKQRAKELREDPASMRQLGTIQTNKGYIPMGVRVTKNGVVQAIGTSIDKFIANASKLIEAAKKSGIETGYESINDPALIEDMQGYVENHQNGYLGDGSAPIVGKEYEGDYVPYEIPEDRFHLLNAAMHNDASIRIDSGGAKGRGDAIEAQQRALENERPVDEETGDVNPLRALINRDGSIDTVGKNGETRKGAGENLETVFETLNPEQIISIKDEPSRTSDIVRDVGFKGNPSDVFATGVPEHKNVAAGFMPTAPSLADLKRSDERPGKVSLSGLNTGKPNKTPSLEEQRDTIQQRLDSQWTKTPSNENSEIKSLLKERSRINGLLREQNGQANPATASKPAAEDTVPQGAGRSVPKGRASFAHWSAKPGLETLDPSSHGTGAVGAESQRRKEDAQSYVNRLYLGYNDYVREPQVGKNRYTGTIDKSLIYDMNQDPLDLMPDAEKLSAQNGTRVSTEYEKLIKEHGFLGYHNGEGSFDSGNVMAIFHPIPASGDVGGKAFAERADAYARRSPEMVKAVRSMTPNFERIEDSYFDPKPIDKAQTAKQGEIAKNYDSLKTDNLADPKVKRAYDALATKIQDQFKQLRSEGINIEAWADKGENGKWKSRQGQPYASSKELQEDLRKNKRVYFFITEPKTFGSSENFPKDHPMLEDSGLKTKRGFPLLNNDILRAVHDAIAHGSFGYEFGPKGEEAAWKAHMATVDDPWARWALTTETRGQNSWVNFRDGFVGDDGLPLKKGDEGYISPKDRPFADQKADLLDPKWMLTGDKTVDAAVKGDKDFMRNFARYEGTKARNTVSGQFMPTTTSDGFKKWFGDYEEFKGKEGGVWNDDKGAVSKVVDKNGEPLRVYHGTKAAGFSVFEGGNKVPGAYFFTNDPNIARTYSGTRKAAEVDIDEDGEVNTSRGNYEAYLNLRNPYEHDMEGANWDGSRRGQYHVRDKNDEAIYGDDGRAYFSKDEAETLSRKHKGSSVEEAADDHYSTDSAVREAMKNGHDGAIIRNVVDSGSEGDYYDPADVYVAFDPAQIKSATENNGKFDPGNPDIRFMPKSPEFKLSKTSERIGDELVPTKIAHIDRAWAGDPDYIGRDDTGIKGRRERFRAFQEKGGLIETPEVSVDTKGNVTFINGRHRFAELRDQGHGDVSVAMSPESKKNADESGMLNGDAQFMPNDSEYLKLAMVEDSKNAQRLVDEAAERVGYGPKKYYHGTKADFTAFGGPTYFTPEKESAGMYPQGHGAKNIHAIYLNEGNKLNLPHKAKDAESKLREEVGNSLIDSIGEGQPIFEYIDDKKIREALQKKGYESVSFLDLSPGNLTEHESVLVFDPSQAKLSDPITRDSSGKIIPLSERFNKRSDDIRFMPGLSGLDSARKAGKSNRTMSNEKNSLVGLASGANPRKREDAKEGTK